MAKNNKGSNFERDVCRQLSLWWTKGENNDVFWRNPIRATRQVKKAEMQLGDIQATDECSQPLTSIILIECKAGYSIKRTKKKTDTTKSKVRNVPWDLLDTIDGKQGECVILKFWSQTVKEAKLANKAPVLIFKRDFHTPVIVIDNGLYYSLEGATWEGGVSLINTLPCICFTGEGIKGGLNFFNLTDFLKVITPEIFKQLIVEGVNV